nr:hypothetical protein DGKKSRWO_DGKKSRWO_CDS_0166 [uncultured phage]CAI9752345.1 hypothetical protein CVNMHQAP_CVNMHQAP_CDS_0168 [uncultured phage]
MSQYVNFFIKHNMDFIPIGCFSRSSYIYQYADAPFEKIKNITPETLSRTIGYLQDEKSKQELEIKDMKDKILHIIPIFNNSVEDKMEEISTIETVIKDYKECIDSINFALGYYKTLREISDSNDDKDVLYYGIEISDPTIGDIVK